LDGAVKFARKLVSKTQISAMPAATIYPGVFGVTGTLGDVRVSALRQYGLLAGDREKGFQATQAAKNIAAAPQEDLGSLYKAAALSPRIFKSLYDVFQGDTTTFAKVRQQSAQLKVHIDTADLCAQTFIDTLKFAGLATVDGDNIMIAGLDAVPRPPTEVNADADDADDEPIDQDDRAAAASNGQNVATPPAAPPAPAALAQAVPPAPAAAHPPETPSGRAVIHVNVTLDSSLDTDKLEKQLQLLRRYGAI
jgi:hypothetical protein